MAKLTYDVSDVEESGGGEVPKPGTYTAKIVEAEHRTEKADGSPANDIKLTLSLGDEYRYLYTYIGLSKSSAWKLKELTTALGLKDKGQIDTDKLKGKVLSIQVKADTYDGEPTAKVGKLFKAKDGAKVGGGKPAAADDDGPDDEPETDEPEGGEDYSEWSLEDLQAEHEERGLDAIRGRKTKDKYIEALEADDEAKADGDGDDGEEPEDAEPEDDYDEWSQDELVAELEERELKVEGRKTKEKLIAALRADDASDPFEDD